MKLDLNFNFKDLAGADMTGEPKVSMALANVLAQKFDGFNAVKAMCIATPLYKDGVVEIDKADLDILEKGVENLPFANLAKSQILDAIKKASAVE